MSIASVKLLPNRNYSKLAIHSLICFFSIFFISLYYLFHIRVHPLFISTIHLLVPFLSYPTYCQLSFASIIFVAYIYWHYFSLHRVFFCTRVHLLLFSTWCHFIQLVITYDIIIVAYHTLFRYQPTLSPSIFLPFLSSIVKTTTITSISQYHNHKHNINLFLYIYYHL